MYDRSIKKMERINILLERESKWMKAIQRAKMKIGEKVHTERDRTKCKRLTGQSGMKAN